MQKHKLSFKKLSPEKVCKVMLLIGKIGMFVGLVGIVAANISIYRWSLIRRFPLDVIITISLVPASGFFIGHGFEKKYRLTNST